MPAATSTTDIDTPIAPLVMPRHWDTAIPAWTKLADGVVLCAAAFWVDQPIAAWALRNNPLTQESTIPALRLRFDVFH